ncbi:hypothetical protein PG996_007865 [Apiospora saccharicola]|uniref:Uncharacterized protein n=1 Tax=Apiospora saccharicola TaxID=335842 RepID=A0ABR1UZI9_9PEZI
MPPNLWPLEVSATPPNSYDIAGNKTNPHWAVQSQRCALSRGETAAIIVACVVSLPSILGALPSILVGWDDEEEAGHVVFTRP